MSPEQAEEMMAKQEIYLIRESILTSSLVTISYACEWNMVDSARRQTDQAGVGFLTSFLNIPSKKILENILAIEYLLSPHPKGIIEQKVGDFYASGKNITAINATGLSPIKPFLKLKSKPSSADYLV